MKTIKEYMILGMIGATILMSCDLEEVGDLNGPTLETILTSSTRNDIQDVIGGVLADMRTRLGTYYDGVGVIGREFYRFSSSDPRFTSDLLGKDEAKLDNSTFYTTAPWGSRYKTVKETNILLEAIENTSPAYTAAEKNGITGFAKTIQAYELLLNLNMMFDNGIRVDVADPLNLGPFLGYEESLAAIEALLLEGATALQGAGDDFAFRLSSGFGGFDKPAMFLKFNKAVAARVAAYQGDTAAVSSYLADSFLDLNGDLNVGVDYVFSTAGGDLRNPMFFVNNASTAGARIAHPSFTADAEADDNRVSGKVALRGEPLSLDGLSGAYDLFIYKTDTDPIPIIRNEELILLYAEANHVSNPGESVIAINIVRNAAMIGPYGGGTSPSELVDEILKQRRYSLYGEGHRWVDMRRFGKLDELPIDRMGEPPSADDEDGVGPDDVWDKFPIPGTENQ